MILTVASLFETTDTLLRAPARLLTRVAEGDRVEELPAQLVLIALSGLGLFGFVLGMTRSLLPGVVSSVKLGFVGLGALAVCIPALHVYGRVLGNDASPQQTVCEALVALATTGMTLVAMTPIWLVFTYFTSSYPLTMLGSIVALGLAGVRGMVVLMRAAKAQGRRVAHLAVWTAIYGLVGLQLAWIARPFVGAPDSRDDFVLLRPLERTAFDAVSRLMATNARSLFEPEARSLSYDLQPLPGHRVSDPRLANFGE
ncbi:MAG TPA: hypothetical protein DFS52_14170 [Myxococcales bacterium]|jgi:hypothetical protein|nr:hypothetical protein [Myxococcales bacterium]